MRFISKSISINLFLILILAVSSSSTNDGVVGLANNQNNNIELNATTVQSTGFVHPGATIHSSDWDPLTTTNALADSLRDPIYISSANKGNYVKGINYGFNLPQNSIINGIEVMIEHATWNGNTGYFATVGLELQYSYKNYTTTTGYSDKVGDTYRGWNDNFKNVTLGSSTDTWGRTWTADDFSDVNFAVNITLQDIFAGSSEAVDIAWVKIFYTVPPTPASIDIAANKNVKVSLDSLATLVLNWNVTYHFGDYINLKNYVNVWFAINGSTYYNGAGGLSYLNNSQVIVDAAATFYDTASNTNIGNFSSLLLIPAVYNVTIVAALIDGLNGFINTTASATTMVTVTDTTIQEPTPTTQTTPVIQFDQYEYNLSLDINQISTVANMSVFVSLINATSYNFTDLTVYVLLNNSFQFSLSWQNGSYNFVDLAQKINSVGYYEFALVFEATNATGYYINASVKVNLKVYDNTTVSDSSSSLDSSITSSDSATEGGNSTSLPELSLDFPFSGVAIFFLGFVAIVNYRRRRY